MRSNRNRKIRIRAFKRLLNPIALISLAMQIESTTPSRMAMHLLAWGGGTLLCCSVISFNALIAGPTAAVAWVGMAWALISHAASGFLVVHVRGAEGQTSVVGPLFCGGLSAFWTITQGALALALVSALQIQISAANANFLLAISCGGLSLLLALASRLRQSELAAQVSMDPTGLQGVDSAQLSRN